MIKPTKEKRTKEIKLRLTENEHKKLMELKVGKELATWIRSVALGVDPIRIDERLVLAIGRLGSNLNQIAKHANIHRQIDVEMLEEVRLIRKALQQIVETEKNEK